jgi:hypothetical protein
MKKQIRRWLSSMLLFSVIRQTFTDVSEVLAASIIRAMSDHPDDGGRKHL